MATISISEYDSDRDGIPKDQFAIPTEPVVTDQDVTYTTASSSAAFNAATKYIRLAPSADCFILFGAAPTALASSQKLFANQEYFRKVVPGHVVSIYDGSS